MESVLLCKEKKKRNVRQTKDQVDYKLHQIREELVDHIGQLAIFIQKENRDMVPYLVELTQLSWTEGAIARHKCYHPDGGFRCYLTHTIDVVKLMTGEQQIIYFDYGI